MKRLARQLDISKTEVETSFNKQKSFTTKEAIHDILKNWLNRQDNRFAAYIAMGEALTHPNVSLNLIAREVLNYPPVEQRNGLEPGVKRKKRNRDRKQRKKIKKTLKHHEINGLAENP